MEIVKFLVEQKEIDINAKALVHDVDSALVQTMEHNKELARSLQESEKRNNILENELKLQHMNMHQLEHEMSKLKFSKRKSMDAFQDLIP